RISMKKSFVSLLFLLFFEISASHAGWSEEGIISHLSIHSGNAIFASLSSLSASDTQAACSTTNNAGQFGFGLRELYSQQLFSMLLSADMASRPVKVFLTGECIQGRPQINGLKIVDEGRSDIYSWNELGEWGACILNNGRCGVGIQHQTVECVRNDGAVAVVANSYCDAIIRPESRGCYRSCGGGQ
ncbi:MAG: thrombospondin type-1 domain-containing protein, partial [Candidatus Sedimenticola sp. (ex Thyasira tokunagai)]